MSDHKDTKATQVIVHGKITGQVDPNGNEHQTYRYHVNIHEQGKSQQHEYDREIHIFKSVLSEDKVKPSANKQQFTEKEGASPQTRRQHNKAKHGNINAILNLKTKLQHYKNTVMQSLGKARLLRLPRIKSSIKKLRILKIKLPSFKFGVSVLINPFLRSKPKKTQKRDIETGDITTTSKTSKTGQTKRSLLEKFSNKKIIRFCLPCILLTVAAIIIYYLQSQYSGKEKIIYPIEPVSRQNDQAVNKDYQAVIEKTGRGVVITLQGPDHEEVLTKLPPGYDPVVEGNKIVHVVTPGNTLWFIAMRYIKNPYRYPELARLNNIKNPDLIYPGEKVIIQYIRKP